MRRLRLISSTFFLALCFLCSSPALVAVAAENSTQKIDVAGSIDRLVQEGNEILSRARRLLADGKYRLAEKSFSSLLESRYSSIVTPELSVAIYSYLSDIIQQAW